MCVYYSQILEKLENEGVISDFSHIVIERDNRAGGYDLPPGFVVLREKRYGSVGVDLLMYKKCGTDND